MFSFFEIYDIIVISEVKNMLEDIKDSINSNPYIEKDIKDALFRMIVAFNDKFPDTKLNKFNELVNDVKVGRISKYESKGVFTYDVNTNEILFSPTKLQEDYNVENLFMQAALGMITATEHNNYKFTGFQSENNLSILNKAYTEILADYLIGSGEKTDLEEEKNITNQLGILIGQDNLLEAYFNNDGNKIMLAVAELCVGLESLGNSYITPKAIFDRIEHMGKAHLSGLDIQEDIKYLNDVFEKMVLSKNNEEDITSLSTYRDLEKQVVLDSYAYQLASANVYMK